MVISIARVGVRVRVMKLFRILLKYTLRLGCQRKERAGERKIERDTHTVKDRERECNEGREGTSASSTAFGVILVPRRTP